MKRLPAMQLWPPLTIRAVAATLAARFHVGILEHQIGIRPAELEHAFLEHRAGRGRDALPAATLPVSVTAAICSSLISASTSLLGSSIVRNRSLGTPAS